MEEQRKMRAQKAQLAKDLKNAQRRRSRLKHKARLLSASDLASVLVLRQEEEEHRMAAAAKRHRSSQPIPRAGEVEDIGDRQPNGEVLADGERGGVCEAEEAGSSVDPPVLT